MQGILRHGDRVVTTSMEHNSVMRPLRALEKKGVDVVVVKCDENGFLSREGIVKALEKKTGWS